MPERLSRTNHPIQHSDKLVGKFNSFLIIASRVELIMNLAHFLLLPRACLPPSAPPSSASLPSTKCNRVKDIEELPNKKKKN